MTARLARAEDAAVQDLIGKLTGELGISEPQAQGSAGLVFDLAKQKLDSGEFSALSQHLGGGLDNLIAAAPSGDDGGGGLLGGLGGGLGGIASAIGGDGLGKLAELATGFDKLGLDADMIGKVVAMVTDFVKERGGAGALELLKKVL